MIEIVFLSEWEFWFVFVFFYQPSITENKLEWNSGPILIWNNAGPQEIWLVGMEQWVSVGLG